MDEKKLYVGLDLGQKYALLSYFTEQMKEPDTVSTIAGSEIYQIPTALCKRRGMGQWHYGQEAVTMMQRQEAKGSERLFARALTGETIVIDGEKYASEELLALFLRKLLQIPQKLGGILTLESLTITMDTLNQDKMRLAADVMERLSIGRERYHVIDYTESFYYYALAQKEELWLHDAALFDYSRNSIRFFYMERNQKSEPQMVHVRERDYGPLIGNKDVAFSDVITEALASRIYSSVYLNGDGFDGEWMQQSLRCLCGGRHVFLGKNLYAKGACYASMVRGQILEWHYAYMGENEMKVNISLKVMEQEELAFHTLISAGENWYEAKHECEILLSQEPEIDFWLQRPDSREATIESLELTDIPRRPERMTRLRVMIEALSDTQVRIVIKDLGFGEIYRSSEKTWEYKMGV